MNFVGQGHAGPAAAPIAEISSDPKGRAVHLDRALEEETQVFPAQRGSVGPVADGALVAPGIEHIGQGGALERIDKGGGRRDARASTRKDRVSKSKITRPRRC